MKRSFRGIEYLQHKVSLTEPDWELVLQHKIPGVFGLVPKEATTWPTGKIVRSAHDLWESAKSAFESVAPQLEAVRSNPDLSEQGRRRQAESIIAPVLTELQRKETLMNEDIEILVDTAPRVLSAVKPLAASDVVGHMQDREIRDFLRSGVTADRNRLHGEMIAGKHPELTSAALRAPSYVLSGFDESQTNRLKNAGTAAAYGDDIEVLDHMRLAFDDARTAALRVIEGLVLIVGRLERGTLEKRINAAFQRNERLEDFKSWLESIPRPPKRAERLMEMSKAEQALRQQVEESGNAAVA